MIAKISKILVIPRNSAKPQKDQKRPTSPWWNFPCLLCMETLIPLTPKLSIDHSILLDTIDVLGLTVSDPWTTLFGFWSSHFWRRCHFWPILKARISHRTALRFHSTALLACDSVEEAIDSFGVSGINISMHNRHGNSCNGEVGLFEAFWGFAELRGITKILLILAIVFTKSHY